MLAQERDSSAGMAVIRRIYGNAAALAPCLDAQLSAKTVDWDEARPILVELNIDTNAMRAQLGVLRKATETTVYEAGPMISASVDRIAWLGYQRSFATFLVVLFVMHHNELAHQPERDMSTGLENRRSFGPRLRALQHSPHPVILVAIDRFERVIGGLGHETGGRLMAHIAARVRGTG